MEKLHCTVHIFTWTLSEMNVCFHLSCSLKIINLIRLLISMLGIITRQQHMQNKKKTKNSTAWEQRFEVYLTACWLSFIHTKGSRSSVLHRAAVILFQNIYITNWWIIPDINRSELLLFLGTHHFETLFSFHSNIVLHRSSTNDCNCNQRKSFDANACSFHSDICP